MKNPGTIFEVQVPEIVGKSSNSICLPSKWWTKWGYARIRLEKNSGTQESGSIKIVVRTMLLLFSSSQNRAYRQFLEPESCVPAFFSTEIVVHTISATCRRPRFWAPPSKLKISKESFQTIRKQEVLGPLFLSTPFIFPNRFLTDLHFWARRLVQ